MQIWRKAGDRSANEINVYDANRQKRKQVYDNGTDSETTIYVGRILEKNSHSSDTDYRNYVIVGGQAVAMLVTRQNGSDYHKYSPGSCSSSWL